MNEELSTLCKTFVDDFIQCIEKFDRYDQISGRYVRKEEAEIYLSTITGTIINKKTSCRCSAYGAATSIYKLINQVINSHYGDKFCHHLSQEE